MQYAIYSAKQAQYAGELEYSTPNGGTVIVTEVSDLPGCPGCQWDDKEDRGEVVEFIRRVSEPTHPLHKMWHRILTKAPYQYPYE
jgi:hypothetical protein